jgi:hypothetical protein
MEHIVIVGSDAFFVIEMSSWPVIQVKLPNEDIRLQNVFNIDAFFKHVSKVLLEQEAADPRVLVLHDVIQNSLHCTYLVAPECRIYGISVK